MIRTNHNKEAHEKVARLDPEVNASNELITQLKHELQVKNDLLHVYTSDLEESSPLELRSINVDLLQKKVTDLEHENKALHLEASKVIKTSD